jgi:hypothetical protein
MHTNRFDALYEIAEMIGCIERYATEQRNGGLLPFEVTFGFYYGAILVSMVPSFEELAAFIGIVHQQVGFVQHLSSQLQQQQLLEDIVIH